jgi:RNA polymerase sigma-32 factor
MSDKVFQNQDLAFFEGLAFSGGSGLATASQSDENALTSYDPLQMYLREIKQFHPLTREKEKQLAIRAKQKDDPDAAYTLVTSNLGLVVKIAMGSYRYWTVRLLDLIQQGNLGLLLSVRKYDPYQGIKFSYYATFWIKAYILRFVMDNWKLVKVGTTQEQRKLFYNLAKERQKLLAEGFIPAPKLLAERLDVKEEGIVEMSQRLGNWEVSLNSQIDEDSRESRESRLSDGSADIEEQISISERRNTLRGELEEFRKTLSGKEADIFDNRIMAEKPLKLRELGDKHHISRERVRQIEEKITKNIKKWLTKEIPNFEEEYSSLAK